MEYLNFQEANCQNCYKCVRTCQVKAIEIRNKQAKIIPELCVGCGECFSICPQNAKNVKTDVDTVKEYIKNGSKLVVSLAPSFPSYDDLDDPLQFVTALKKLGFTTIEETTIGAAQVSAQYEKDYNSDQLHVITTSCPTVNFLITKYYSHMVKYMSKTVSPMMAHNKIIKSQHKDVYTVFIGPCISKKEETKVCFSKDSCIDFVITFDDIREWLFDEDIDITTLPPTAFDNEAQTKMRWYPLSGGVEKATINEKTNRRVIKVDGMSNCIELLDSLEDIKNPTWIEMNACHEGCINGFGNDSSPLSLPKKVDNVINYIDNTVGNNCKKQQVDISFDYNMFPPVKEHSYTEEQITRVLHQTGKYAKEDELNCAACGYNTCREKAIAVLDNKAEIDMCLPYMRMKNEDISSVIIENTPNGIIVANKRLEIIEFNPSSVTHFMVSKKNALGKTVEEITGENIFADIDFTTEEPVVKKQVFKSLGKVMITSMKYIPKHNLFLGIFKDITQEEKRKLKEKKKGEEALEMAQEVIDKQMMIAHEIASLLGETTAETKVTLSKFKKLFNDYD